MGYPIPPTLPRFTFKREISAGVVLAITIYLVSALWFVARIEARLTNTEQWLELQSIAIENLYAAHLGDKTPLRLPPMHPRTNTQTR